MQNLYNLTDRQSEDVLDYCEAQGIGFIPWFPIAAGDLAAPGGPLADDRRATGATPAQVALAWLLQRPRSCCRSRARASVEHLEENVAAAGVTLTEEELATLDAAAAA